MFEINPQFFPTGFFNDADDFSIWNWQLNTDVVGPMTFDWTKLRRGTNGMDTIRYAKNDPEGKYTIAADNEFIYEHQDRFIGKGWRMYPTLTPEPAPGGAHVVFIEADNLDCGICDVRLKLCSDETPLPHEIANLFFFFECHRVDPMDNEPVVGSTGIAAMGQINHLGD